jgi:hypothetical protein
MPSRYFSVPAYFAVVTIALTGEIDHRPLPPRLRLHPPCTCQDLTNRREIIIVVIIIIGIIGIKDLSVLRETDILLGGKSGGLNAGVREGYKWKTALLLLTMYGCR